MARGELVDIVDARSRTKSVAQRRVAHNKQLLHKAVLILVFDKQGRIFTQERSVHKDVFPGLHEASLSGHVKHGETESQAAVRELKEELRLKVKPAQLKKLFASTVRAAPEYEQVTVYKLITDKQPRIGPEVKAGTFIPSGMLCAFVDDVPSAFTPIFSSLFGRLRPILRSHDR